MLALINRVWHRLDARSRQAPAEESISFTIPCHDLPALLELVKAAPGLRLESSGWAAIACTVAGSTEAIAAFWPTLQAWQHECGSRDAW